MFLIIYCSLGSTFAYQQWFSACPCLTLPARHNLISFVLVLYSLLHLPVVSPICCLPVPLLYLPVITRFPAFLPVPYFTCPSFSFPGPCLSFQSSYSSSSFPSPSSSAVGVVRIAVPRRIVARHLLDLPCKRNCNPVLGASLRIGLRFVWRESFSS